MAVRPYCILAAESRGCKRVIGIQRSVRRSQPSIAVCRVRDGGFSVPPNLFYDQKNVRLEFFQASLSSHMHDGVFQRVDSRQSPSRESNSLSPIHESCWRNKVNTSIVPNHLVVPKSFWNQRLAKVTPSRTSFVPIHCTV